jgi:signal transduction histidine kinase
VQIAPEAAEIFSIKSYIKSILYNLVNNAIKYRSSGKDPLIEIGISKANEQIEIRVQDNGIGIDLVKYGHDIFGLYKRFHPSFEGKGLGLNMTKVQVESLGGSIQIASQPGEGTLFTICLPVSGPKALNND